MKFVINSKCAQVYELNDQITYDNDNLYDGILKSISNEINDTSEQYDKLAKFNIDNFKELLN